MLVSDIRTLQSTRENRNKRCTWNDVAGSGVRDGGLDGDEEAPCREPKDHPPVPIELISE